jgi:hypothetical protein
MGLWGEMRSFYFVLSDFSLVAATSILAATMRVGATIRRKNNFSFSGVAEEVMATVRVGTTFFF